MQIAHAMGVHTTSQATWTILNTAERDVIKQSDDVDPAENDSCWTCNHCAIHLDDYQTRRKVIDHLKEVYVYCQIAPLFSQRPLLADTIL